MSQRKVVSALLKSTRPLIFGMIHVPALPGTPCHKLPMNAILKNVRQEAELYSRNNLDGIIVENMHDIPYMKPPANPEIISAMTLACSEVVNVKEKFNTNIFLGIQVLAAANKEALAIAHVTGMDFVRAEGFVYSHVADEGWIDACAGALLRFRSNINADNIAVFTDIKKKHSSHSVTNDLSIQEMAKDAQFNCVDGVIVTGSATGCAANPEELKQVSSLSNLPVLIGSGINSSNAKNYKKANGFIVGSEFKVDGNWKNPLDENRIKKFMRTIKQLDRFN
ncbi:unnamed protein product [Caenorhabditis bovis]|uniref:BtpA family membrane complex biogenesis protein n=1 Tax=Caenorhabditis bovis TaxID=2654633 RepID=A0A8S1E873_9PELO|nr:unnamed protein product [Caenorhabditis bovis]